MAKVIYVMQGERNKEKPKLSMIDEAIKTLGLFDIDEESTHYYRLSEHLRKDKVMQDISNTIDEIRKRGNEITISIVEEVV